MAVADHLKLASAEILKASDLVKLEIDQLRKDGVSRQREIDGYIAQLLLRIQGFEKEVKSADDSSTMSQHQTQIVQLQREIADKRSEHTQVQKNVDDQISQKNSLIADLEAKARSISP